MRTVVVLAGPTGPTGTYERVNIFAAFTGATGQFEQCQQVAGASGPRGIISRVYPSGGPTAGVRNIIIAGYTGPA